MHQNCDFGFIMWFQHCCFFNTDFTVSRLWWQQRDVFVSYVDHRWVWVECTLPWEKKSLCREHSQNMGGGGQQGIPRWFWKLPIGFITSNGAKGSYAELDPASHPYLWVWLPVKDSFCVYLILSSGGKNWFKKGTRYHPWPLLISQSVIPLDLFLCMCLFLMWDSAMGNL